MSTLIKRASVPVVVLAVFVGTLMGVGSLGASATADGPGCDTPWGSLPDSVDTVTQGAIDNLRVGRHACYDRLVVDVDGGTAGVTVRYVDQLVEDGRGDTVPARGGAILEVRVHSPAHDQNGDITYLPVDRSETVSVRGFSTFRQVIFLGSFEGDTQLGLGVRARLPFRAFVLDGPGDGSRVVVDVAHRWPTSPDGTSSVDVYFSTGDGSDCGEVSAFHRSAARTRGVAKLAIDQLVAGPTADEQASGSGSVFTARTAGAVRSVDLDDGLLVVDFRDIRADLNNASTSCGSQALLAQLNSTAFQFPTVHRVRYQINGSCDAFAGILQRDCTVYER